MRKRKLKIFPIFCILVVIAVAIWAITLISGNLKKENPKEENDIHGIEENENINEESYSPDDAGINSEKPDVPDETLESESENEVIEAVPEEDKIEFVDGAPKPLYTHAELLQMYPESVLDSSEDAGDSYIDEIVFIGDSTTHGMAHYAVLSGGKETNQVWTPKSGTLAMWNLLTENIVYPEDGSEMLIGDALALRLPDKVVLTLGVNGVSSLSEAEFKKYYQALIDTIKTKSTETTIILQSIYPVCDYYQYVNSISMEKINTANSWIAQLANDNGIYYLNTISALVNENGYLNNDYCNGDGIHISKQGFNVILDYIRTHAID